MSLIKSPARVISLEDSTNMYFKNRETLTYMKKLETIKNREKQFVNIKPILRKSLHSCESDSKILL